ncbi:hypothetical protein F5Y00DRAFT_269970 [Daldinia vernicosa]|uniref:uncharacterized protein n=1 Tax=Daldinia vernicosa TaxID=114800 RepID=UPI002007ABE3|nr:uncharacterized protein F5Y00DRAFT_269970 [Daldinia vernicosa]KAI0848748.1 hypothetical protein F5Y00DRAFT_269970 [Daldinia vernicosa]
MRFRNVQDNYPNSPSDEAPSQYGSRPYGSHVGTSSSPWFPNTSNTPPRTLNRPRGENNSTTSIIGIYHPDHNNNHSPWLEDDTGNGGFTLFDPIFPSPSIQAIHVPQFITTPPSGGSRGSRGGYTPMGQGAPWGARHRLPPDVWNRQLAITGISENYGGNIFLPSNQSADVPEHESTSLWLTNLPPRCTHQMLLGAIRNCGKIWATVINPPSESTGRFRQRAPHTTSASKLVFFDRAGVDNLLAKSEAGEFSVEGYVPKLKMNRIRSAPRDPSPHCRVLHIEGPNCIVNEPFLHAFFRSKFNYELEAVLTLSMNSLYTRQEWRFGSFRCQAESARQSIAREKIRTDMSELDTLNWREVQVYFGVDPCAPPPGFSP